MFSNLAVKNVKKSIKDYLIYFLTMTFGVCLFYMFNSIDSQTSMMQLSTAQCNYIDALIKLIDSLSVFISVILGLLIVYANQFLIRRRKKELGIYMTLGMNKSKISMMIVFETLIIGVFALVVGLLLGVFASQGLSVLTAKMFKAALTNFYFIFSVNAFYKTLVYFGIIFLVVMAFNTISISRLKLIDLINAQRKNEDIKIRSLYLSVFIFIISVCCLGTAYYLIIKNGMFEYNLEFAGSIILGSIGTLLFFFSLSGFLLRVIQTNKKLYYKNLNMFVLRQINSKINTTFVSMSVICIMLLLTIGALSSGMSLSSVLSQDLDKKTPYDVSFIYMGQKEKSDIAEEVSKDINMDLNKYAKEYNKLTIYNQKIPFKDLNLDFSLIKNPALNKGIGETGIFKIVSESDYNNAMKMQGKPTIELKDNQYALTNAYSDLAPMYNSFLKNNSLIKLSGQEFKPLNTTVLEDSFYSNENFKNTGTFIVKDKYVKNLNISLQVLNLNLKEDIKEHEFLDKINNAYKGEERPFDVLNTRSMIYEESAGMSTTISFVAIYIGLIFLITSAAVLALQQLSEASDNVERYNLLRKLGTEEKMINHALFIQIAIYFFMPLSLAIIHSYVGISVVNNIVSVAGNINIVSNTFYTALVFLIIYGGYFFATYLGSRSMIKAKRN